MRLPSFHPSFKRSACWLLAPLLILLLNACASLGNQAAQRVQIDTSLPTRLVWQGDTLWLHTQHVVQVTRKNEPISLVLLGDSSTRELTIPPRNSFLYWYNLPSNGGIGMLIDKNNPRRYGYTPHLYVDWSDTTAQDYRFSSPRKKGSLDLRLSLPHINHFVLRPEGEPDAKAGIGYWGINAGLDYYHRSHQFFSFQAGIVLNFPIPVPAAVDLSGEFEMMQARYLSLFHHHRYRRWVLGYGIQYAAHTWQWTYYDRFDPLPPTRQPLTIRGQTVGFVTSVTYETGQRFGIGLTYRPGIFHPGTSRPFAYEHTLSLEVAWKLPLIR